MPLPGPPRRIAPLRKRRMSLGYTLLRPHLTVKILDIHRYPLPHSFVETGRVPYVPLLHVGSPLLRLFPLSNCRLPALSLPNGSTVDYWLSAGGSALPLFSLGAAPLCFSRVRGFLRLRSSGGPRAPAQTTPKTILPPIPFSTLTHAPVISIGMNDSSRFPLRGWPTLLSRSQAKHRDGGITSISYSAQARLAVTLLFSSGVSTVYTTM